MPGDTYIFPKGQKTPGGDKQATDKHRTNELRTCHGKENNAAGKQDLSLSQ